MHDIANKRFGFYPTSTKTITAGEIPSKPYTSYTILYNTFTTLFTTLLHDFYNTLQLYKNFSKTLHKSPTSTKTYKTFFFNTLQNFTTT